METCFFKIPVRKIKAHGTSHTKGKTDVKTAIFYTVYSSPFKTNPAGHQLQANVAFETEMFIKFPEFICVRQSDSQNKNG